METNLKELVLSASKEHLRSVTGTFYFACLGGSRLRGLQNSASDYDFYVFYKTNLDPLEISVESHDIGNHKVDGQISKIDLQYHNLQYYFNYSKQWSRDYALYSAEPIIDNYYRPNLFTSLCSNVIFFDDIEIDTLVKIAEMSFKRDLILDYFLSHNLWVTDNYIKKDTVRVRTYLYVLFDIFCFQWILETGSMPLKQFFDMFLNFLKFFTEDEYSEIEKLFKNNLTSTIPYQKNYIARNRVVEGCIVRLLEKQKISLDQLFQDSTGSNLIFDNKSFTLSN